MQAAALAGSVRGAPRLPAAECRRTGTPLNLHIDPGAEGDWQKRGGARSVSRGKGV